jgi:hypothetical protein
MLSPLSQEKVFADIIDKTAKADKFSPQQIAQWKALRGFHDKYTASADLPPSGITDMPLSPESDLDLIGLERPLCKVSTPPPWSELWRHLAYRFRRPHLEGGPSAGAAAARPTPVAQPLPPAQRPLPSLDELVVGNRGVVGINQSRAELAQSKRNLEVSTRIEKMPAFEPVVKKGKLYFVQVDKGLGAQLAPQCPRGCPQCYCARPGRLTSPRPERVGWTYTTTLPPQLTRALHACISGEGNFFVGLAKAKADGARSNIDPIDVVWWTIGKNNMTSADWSDTQIFIKAAELAPLHRQQLTTCEPRVRFLPIPVVLTGTANDAKPRLSKETVQLVRQWCASKLLLQAPPACWQNCARAPKRARGRDKANRKSEARSESEASESEASEGEASEGEASEGEASESEGEASESEASEGEGEEELGSVRDDAGARQAVETEKRAGRAVSRRRG